MAFNACVSSRVTIFTTAVNTWRLRRFDGVVATRGRTHFTPELLDQWT